MVGMGVFQVVEEYVVFDFVVVYVQVVVGFFQDIGCVGYVFYVIGDYYLVGVSFEQVVGQYYCFYF